MSQSKSKNKHKPILVVHQPLSAKVYKAVFKPFESTKYLDVHALKAANKATIECGTVEAPGVSQTVAAEIQNGMIVALKPVACKGCQPKPGKKRSESALRKTNEKIAEGLKQKGIFPTRLPIPVKISPLLGIEIPIGPIIIVIGDDFCIEIWNGNRLCWWCLFSPNGCIDFGPPLP